MERRKARISEICKLAGVSFIGKDVIVNGLNLCNRNTQYKSILGYVTSNRFFETIFSNSALRAIILSESLYREIVMEAKVRRKEYSYIVCEQAEILFYDIHNLLWEKTDFYNHNIEKPIIGDNCKIHPSVVLENGVVIGNNVVISPNAVVRSGSVIEDNVTIGCCSIIGSEGFQAIQGYNKMIKHVGGTYISHDVHIGDNTTIGNSLFEGNTVIGAYTKISNHCQISHNCIVGNHCIVTTSCIMMGSTELEDGVWLAPNSVVRNGRIVHENATVGTLSFVNKDVDAGRTVVGIPAKELLK